MRERSILRAGLGYIWSALGSWPLEVMVVTLLLDGGSIFPRLELLRLLRACLLEGRGILSKTLESRAVRDAIRIDRHISLTLYGHVLLASGLCLSRLEPLTL